jgi:multidrug efflux system membrane fusion protein
MKKNDGSKPTTPPRLRRRWAVVLLMVCLIAIGAYIFFSIGQSRSAKKGQSPVTPMVPVIALEAKKADFNLYISGLGSVTPLNTVTVRTRVDGQPSEVLFRKAKS